MKVYLVINKCEDKRCMTPYKDLYKIFIDKNKAIEHAKSIGYEDGFLGFDDTIGMINFFQAGDTNVMILVTEVI